MIGNINEFVPSPNNDEMDPYVIVVLSQLWWWWQKERKRRKLICWPPGEKESFKAKQCLNGKSQDVYKILFNMMEHSKKTLK